MLSVITALEFFQHYFSEMGHRDLLVTQNLSQAIKQPTLSYLTRSVRRTGGFVLAGFSKVICALGLDLYRLRAIGPSIRVQTRTPPTGLPPLIAPQKFFNSPATHTKEGTGL